jgi:uncharacterized membrane protein YeiB
VSTDGNHRDTGERAEEVLGGGPSMMIGFYISAMLLIFGVILVLYGLLGPAKQLDKSLNTNVDLWWGLFMVLIGCIVLGLSLASPRRRAQRERRRL